MSDSKRTSGKSVAAFLFLPQFGQSLEGAKHIIPVFVRMLALLFSQSGLIRLTHPALGPNSGLQGFRELMGEAWFTLRSTKASLNQWCAFMAVVLVICLLSSTAILAAANTAFGIGQTAQAQIFTAYNSPYGGSDTSLDAVKKSSSASGMFDTRFTDGVSQDFAFMALDKVIRQSAVGAGGATQKALGTGLLKVYNEGMLVIAAIMVFWLIVAIVIDTARTGQVGGRYNMVWAPIRIVFALGIMIPISNGFSSGQFAVLKLAEWGSNFATRGWVKYIENVSSSAMVGSLNPKSVKNIVNGISKIKVCQAAYNAHIFETTGTNIGFIDDKKTTTDYKTGKKTVYFTNDQASAMCGAVTFNKEPSMDFVETLRDAKSGLFNIGSGALSGGNLGAGVAAGLELNRLANGFSRLKDVGSLNDLLDPHSGSIYKTAEGFACSFVKALQHAHKSGSDDPLIKGGICSGYSTICGGGVTGFPNLKCQLDMSNKILTLVESIEKEARGQVDAFAKSGLQRDMKVRGWAGMGLWYSYISQLGSMTRSLTQVTFDVTPGVAWTPGGDGTTQASSAAVGEYDRWWSAAVVDAGSNSAAGSSKTKKRYAEMASDSDKMSDDPKSMEEALRADKGGRSTGNQLVAMIDSDAEADWFLIDIMDEDNQRLYPMTAVVRAGDTILNWGLGIATAVTIFQATFGGTSFCAEGGWNFIVKVGGQACWGAHSWAHSALVNGLGAIGYTLIICGIVMSFYLPVLPMIKVAMAVLTWVISVFEAVVMIPVAALTFLNADGEGMGSKHVWTLWLNVLLRPILVVIGFVGAMLVYNTFILFFQKMFSEVAAATVTARVNGPIDFFIAKFAYTIIYFATIYTAANTIMKMIDMIPNHMMRWIGGPSPDQSFDGDNSEGMMIAGSQLMNRFQKSRGLTDDEKEKATNAATAKNPGGKQAGP